MKLAIFCATVIVAAVLGGYAYLLKLAGTEFSVGVLVGFIICYVLYRNWRQDYEDERKPHFTDLPE